MQHEFRLSAPIVKVDEDQKIVYAYATSEDIDKQGEIVDYQASKKAFGSWIDTLGNIREMHQPKVVGKAFEATYEDDAKRVLIGLKLSESTDGRDAWTKVKEGLFTGLSIGGKVKQVVQEAAAGSKELINRITDYDLTEVSLVDNPANPAAQFVMVKSIDGQPKPVEVFERVNDRKPEAWWVKHYGFTPDQQLNKDHDMAKAKQKDEVSPETTTPAATAVVAQEDGSTTVESIPGTTEVPSSKDPDGQIVDNPPSPSAKEESLTDLLPHTPEGNGYVNAPADPPHTAENTGHSEQTIEAAPGTLPEKADVPEDLIKAVGAVVADHIAKLASQPPDDLTKTLTAKLDAAVDTIKSLEGRVAQLETLPLATKVKASYATVEKGDLVKSDADKLSEEWDELLAKAEEFGKSAHAATPAERGELMERMRVVKRELAAIAR